MDGALTTESEGKSDVEKKDEKKNEIRLCIMDYYQRYYN